MMRTGTRQPPALRKSEEKGKGQGAGSTAGKIKRGTRIVAASATSNCNSFNAALHIACTTNKEHSNR